MKDDNLCLMVVVIVAMVAISSLVLVTQKGGPDGALSAETTCYRNFYYCIELTETPVASCLDYQTRCLEIGP